MTTPSKSTGSAELKDREHLFKCIFDALFQCDTNEIQSVAFPAFCTAKGFKFEEVAHITWWAIKRYIEVNPHTQVNQIEIYVYQEQTDYQNFMKYWRKYFDKDLQDGTELKLQKSQTQQVVDEEKT